MTHIHRRHAAMFPAMLVVLLLSMDAVKARTSRPYDDISIESGNWFAWNLHFDAGDTAGFHVNQAIGHAPAGKFGHLKIRDGHFYLEGHGPIRFWGTNVTFNDNFPSHDNARGIAKRLAKLGYNLVRFHHFDFHEEGFQLGDSAYTRTGKLNRDLMDRMCYFISELKKNGIYYNLNLLTLRTYKGNPRLPESHLLPDRKNNKFLSIFAPEAQAMQKKFMRDILTWKNEYTGLTLGEDPAMAMVETNNEDSLMTLLKHGIRNRLPPHYYNILTRQFNAFLQKKYKSNRALQAAWGDSLIRKNESLGSIMLPGRAELAKPPFSGERLNDIIRFLVEVEHNHYKQMRTFLSREMGCKALLGGVNNWYSHAGTRASIGAADYLDMHGYFNKAGNRHKNIPGWRHADNVIENVWDKNFLASITDRYPDNSYPAWLGQLQNDFFKYPKNFTEGIPSVISEWNHQGPTRRPYQMSLLLCAYACLQDWDALLQFQYYGHANFMKQAWTTMTGYDVQADKIFGKLSAGFHPSHMAQAPAASLAFRRGDIAVAKKTIYIDMREEKWLQAVDDDPFDTRIALQHRVRKIYDGQRKFETYSIPDRPESMASDTGEIVWETNFQNDQGRIVVNAPRTQAATGNLEMGPIVLENIEIDSRTPSAIWLTSLTTAPIRQSPVLLLTAAGDAQNSGTVYKAVATDPAQYPEAKGAFYMAEVGHAPVLMEKIDGEITVKGLKHFQKLAVYPLDRNGVPTDPVKVRITDDGWTMRLDAASTALYRVEITR